MDEQEERLNEAFNLLVDGFATDIEFFTLSTCVGHVIINGKLVQVQMKFTTNEKDFIREFDVKEHDNERV